MYSFYLDKTKLPVTPKKLTLKIKGNNKALDLANEGALNFLRAPGLTEISFEALLPMLDGYSFSEKYKRPDYYLSILEKYMTDKEPFQFIVSRISPSGELLFDTNIKVSLENYTLTEDATGGLDMTVNISLKQYVPYATKTVSIIVPKPKSDKVVVKTTAKRAGPERPNGKTHTVVKGDCLWAIAQKYMGNGSKYPQLYEANKAVIDAGNRGTKNPKYTIYPGQVFVIP